MESRINHIELHMNEGTDVARGLANFSLKHHKSSVVKGSQSADTQSALTLQTGDSRRVTDIPVLRQRLEIIAKALETYAVWNLSVDIRLVAISL